MAHWYGIRKLSNRANFFEKFEKKFWKHKNFAYLCIVVEGSTNGPGLFPVKVKAMKTKVSFDKLVYMGVKMVLDCTPVGMAVAVLAATNNLSAQQAVELKGAIISQLR